LGTQSGSLPATAGCAEKGRRSLSEKGVKVYEKMKSSFFVTKALCRRLGKKRQTEGKKIWWSGRRWAKGRKHRGFRCQGGPLSEVLTSMENEDKSKRVTNGNGRKG